MNPQFNYTRLTPQVQAPVLKPYSYQVTLQDVLNGGTTQGATVDPLTGVQKTLTDNLPNILTGGVGLFMILVAIGAIAAPVAKEII